jgi:hypothetical protein
MKAENCGKQLKNYRPVKSIIVENNYRSIMGSIPNCAHKLK